LLGEDEQPNPLLEIRDWHFGLKTFEQMHKENEENRRKLYEKSRENIKHFEDPLYQKEKERIKKMQEDRSYGFRHFHKQRR